MELFDYCEDGTLIRKILTANNVKVGDVIGYTIRNDYIQVKIDRIAYYLHRLIYLYHNGYLPRYLDHVDGDPHNNRIENLRPATRIENGRNRKKNKNCLSNYKGVTFNPQGKNWRSRITIDGKLKHLGYFKDEKDAAVAYNKAAIEYFGEFINLNEI